MDSFLTVVSRFGGRQSLSCNDLEAIDSGYDSIKQKRKDTKDSTLPRACPRYLRSKSHSSESPAHQSVNRTKRPKSSSELVNSLDCQFAQIRENLAMLRKQDTNFHQRLDSLSNSIGELTSRSSLNSVSHSENSDASGGVLWDADDDNGEEKNYTEDNQTTQSKIEGICTSFSSEVLNSIPIIKVTAGSYKKNRSSKRSARGSDPSVHESANFLNVPTKSSRHSICLADYVYLYGSGEEVSTTL